MLFVQSELSHNSLAAPLGSCPVRAWKSLEPPEYKPLILVVMVPLLGKGQLDVRTFPVFLSHPPATGKTLLPFSLLDLV